MRRPTEPTTVYRCSYCEPDEACGLDGRSFDCSHDECHHPLSLEEAEFMAEAFNVYAETGLTPRQLAEQVTELVAVLGSAVGGVGHLARSHERIAPELVKMWEEWESKARSALSAAIAPQTP